MTKIFSALTLITLLSACSSSPYKYHVNPTPIEKGKSSFVLGQVSVSLTPSIEEIEKKSGAKTQLVNAKQMEEMFKHSINKNLKELGLLNDKKPSYIINIKINYKRTFNYGGKALNKPQISHSIEILDEDQKLVSFGKGKYTTKYAYFEDAAVNIEIASFNWDHEDEPRDIELISELIADDIAGVGK